MELSKIGEEIQDEILEILWTELEEGGRESVAKGEIVIGKSGPVSDEAILALADQELITMDGDRISLTEPGFEEARKTIRRHRLSERLFMDIFDILEEEVENAACRFEHMLIKPELEVKICELLGHPKECPHGRAIPLGECCLKAEAMVDKAVVPMSRLRQGENGLIAYVHSADSEKLKKLMAMGILPGEEITLERRYPSFVFTVGYTRYAVDEGMASAILVKRSRQEAS